MAPLQSVGDERSPDSPCPTSRSPPVGPARTPAEAVADRIPAWPGKNMARSAAPLAVGVGGRRDHRHVDRRDQCGGGVSTSAGNRHPGTGRCGPFRGRRDRPLMTNRATPPASAPSRSARSRFCSAAQNSLGRCSTDQNSAREYSGPSHMLNQSAQPIRLNRSGSTDQCAHPVEQTEQPGLEHQQPDDNGTVQQIQNSPTPCPADR